MEKSKNKIIQSAAIYTQRDQTLEQITQIWHKIQA